MSQSNCKPNPKSTKTRCYSARLLELKAIGENNSDKKRVIRRSGVRHALRMFSTMVLIILNELDASQQAARAIRYHSFTIVI